MHLQQHTSEMKCDRIMYDQIRNEMIHDSTKKGRQTVRDVSTWCSYLVISSLKNPSIIIFFINLVNDLNFDIFCRPMSGGGLFHARGIL